MSKGRFPPIPETAAPAARTYKPTDTITLDIADGRVVVRECLPGPHLPEKSLPPADMADLSSVQELRVRLMRDGFYGACEERQLQALSRVVVTGMTSEAFVEETRRRFGPWPRPERDPKAGSSGRGARSHHWAPSSVARSPAVRRR